MKFTFDELNEFVNDEWENMDEEEQHFRMIDNNPTFAEYVRSIIKKNDIVEIDFENQTFSYCIYKNKTLK